MGLWNDIYDEILAYYFWEPQHLGKIKNPKSSINTYRQLIEHSKKLEVSLNHQLSLFFSLAPKSFINGFFSKAFNTKINDNFIFDSSSLNSLITELKDLTQPDFFFVGDKNIVAIEMKIDAKTSLDQYMKYLLFNLLYQSKMGTNKQFSLLYLGKGKQQQLWKEGFVNFEQAKQAFKVMELPIKSKKGSINILGLKPSLIELSENTNLGYMTYEQLLTHVKEEKALATKDEMGSMYARLLQGIENEFGTRELNI